MSETHDPWQGIYRAVRCLKIEVDDSIVTALLERLDAAKAHMEARHAEELTTLRAEAKSAKDRMWEVGHENATLRARLAAVQQQGESVRHHADELRQYALLMNDHDGRVVRAGAEAIFAALASPSTPEPQTLRAQLAAVQRQIQAGLKQLMADAFAAKLTATDAADVAYVAGLQKGIDIIAALASPSTPEPQTCEWRVHDVWAWPTCRKAVAVRLESVEEFQGCPYCGKPLALSPDQPTEAQ